MAAVIPTQFLTPPPAACLHCGYSFGSLQTVERLSSPVMKGPPTLRTQGKDVQGELPLLEDLVRHHAQERVRLLRRINDIRPATRDLPPEVLSTIFQFACPPVDFSVHGTPYGLPNKRKTTHKPVDDFKLILGAVSHRWRQVVWAAPQLWTTFSVKIYRRDCHRHISLLDLYFKNSGSLPMMVELDYVVRQTPLLLSPQQWDVSNSLSQATETLILSNAARIHNLIITGLPFQHISFVSRSFPQCESMTLNLPRSPFDRHHSLDLAETPLRHFRAENFHALPTLPWSTIVTVQLCGMPIEYSVELLTKCPNLAEFASIRPQSGITHLPILDEPVVLEHLESFTWDFHFIDHPRNSAFLRHACFSKLRTLRWSVGLESSHVGGYDTLSTFFSRLPETLQVLELSNIHYSFQGLITILTSVPQLLELIMGHSSWRSLSNVTSMIGRHVDEFTGDPFSASILAVDPNKSNGPIILPHLRKFMISDDVAILGTRVITEMLEALHEANTLRERFHLSLVQTTCPWDSKFLGRLEKLALSGFDFEIMIDGNPLNYMSTSS